MEDNGFRVTFPGMDGEYEFHPECLFKVVAFDRAMVTGRVYIQGPCSHGKCPS